MRDPQLCLATRRAVGLPLEGPPSAPPLPSRPRPVPVRSPPQLADSKTLSGAGHCGRRREPVRAPGPLGVAGRGEARSGTRTARRRPLRAPLSALPLGRATSLPGRRSPQSRSEPRSRRSAKRGAPEPGSGVGARHPSRSERRAALRAAWLPLLPPRARAGSARRRGGRRGGGGGGGDGGGEAGAREKALGERHPSRAAGSCGPAAERRALCCWRCYSAGTRG